MADADRSSDMRLPGSCRRRAPARGRRQGVGVLGGFLVATLLAACSGAGAQSTTPSAATPGVSGAAPTQAGRGAVTGGGYVGDVCGLLSADEILEVTGLDVAIGRNATPGQRDCEWYSDRGAVTVAALGGPPAFDGPRSLNLSSPVQGVGDAAYWVGATDELVVRAGPTVFSINVDLPNVRVSYDDAVQLATLVLPRL